MKPANPYSAGRLITGPTMFFGRQEELKYIRDRLRKGDSTAVIGLRRTGKSSLLYQAAHSTIFEPALNLPQGQARPSERLPDKSEFYKRLGQPQAEKRQ